MYRAKTERMRIKAAAFGLLLAVFAAVGSLAAVPAQAVSMTYIVDSTADTNLTACTAAAGDCTLRGAINAANANADADTIEFDIPGAGVRTITPGSSLPGIFDQVTIDGYSQDGSSVNTLAEGNDAVLLIELNGSSAPITGAFGQAGLTIFASGGGSTVRGLVINRFANPNAVGIPGIVIMSGDNVIEGNFIGTDPTGTLDQGNGTRGVAVVTGARNRIGGAVPAARNVISGNGTTGGGNPGYGVFVGSSGDQSPGPTDTEILGNYIGTDAAGTAALPNSDTGIVAPEGIGTKIGGDDDDDGDEDGVVGARNVISGHLGSGIFVVATEDPNDPNAQFGMEIQGNYIGTDATGAAALGNSDGVTVSADFMPRADVSVGGTAPGAGNVISGNRNFGLQVFSVREMDVEGNLVGTGASGTNDLGNGAGGLYFPINPNAPSDYAITIGGAAPEARNVISGNGGDGVNVGGQTNGFVHLRRNLIGTQIDGESPLGNEGDGIELSRPATVGGAGHGNTIAYNGGDGVLVRQFDQPGATSGMGILGNSIFSNGGLGIDLHDTSEAFCPEDEECPPPEPNAANDGVTPNDAGDPDAGPNNVQNFPVIASATTSGAATSISGTLNSTANTTFRLEFFASEACDASGFGEGRTFIGARNVITNGSGNASFGPLSFAAPAGQSVITATATAPANNTSEFSRCRSATIGANNPPVAVNDAYATNEDTSLTVPDGSTDVLSNDTDAENNPLTVAPPRPISGPSNGTLALRANGSFTYTPNANFNGADSFTYKANDGAADSATAATVRITVNPVNDAPSFTKGPNQTVAEDSGKETVSGWATNISEGPANESGQTLSFSASNDKNALFTTGGRPAISPNGTLTYTPAPNANGSAVVTVKLKDNGGTARGGVDESAQKTFTITVNAASPRADLSVRVNAPSSVRLGQNYRYTTTTMNRGPDTARNVTSRVVVPRSVRIVAIPGSCKANRSKGAVVCNLGNMPDGAVRRFRITVKPMRAGTVQLRSYSVSSATPDSNASNNRIGQSSGQPQARSAGEAPETTVASPDSEAGDSAGE